MAGRNGASTIIKASRDICRMVGKYGIYGLSQVAPPSMVSAVLALQSACLLFESLDDYPGEIDQTNPQGPEDETPAEG